MVPSGGPALDGSGWRVARHPRHRRRRKPYLTDVVELGQAFREAYLRGLKRLLRQEKLKIGGRVAFLHDSTKRKAWFDHLERIDWNVFSQGPPRGKSDPVDVVKYLARYLTGGSIANHRLISANDKEVWFWARPKQPSAASRPQRSRRSQHRGMNAPRPFRLSASEFVRRWALHILPKGFIRSRCYGGYHGTKRTAYLDQCRELLGASVQEPDLPTPEPLREELPELPCPHCASELRLTFYQERPSWKEVFERGTDRPRSDNRQFHRAGGRSPPRKEFFG